MGTRLREADRTKHVKDWRGSGLSKPDYCRKHGLNISSFYRWLGEPKSPTKNLSIPSSSQPLPLIPINVIENSDPPVSLATSGSSGIRIHVRDQFVVELDIGFDAASLERLWKMWG